MGTLRIWPATNGPETTALDSDNYTLGVEFYVTAAAKASAVFLWRPASSPATTFTVGIYRIDSPTTGTLLGSVAGNTAPANANGWQRVQLSSPITLVVNQRYRAVVHSTTDNFYGATAGYWNTDPGSAGHTNDILVAVNASNANNGAQGSFVTGSTMAFPTTGFNAGNYWVDVEVDTGSPLTTIVEVDTVVPLEKTKIYDIPMVTETDTAEALVSIGTISASLTIATETDTVQPLTKQKDRAPVIAAETDTAPPLSVIGTIAVSLTPATVTTSAPAIGSTKTHALSTLVETDTTPAIGKQKTRALVNTDESDTTPTIEKVHERDITVVDESDSVLTLSKTVSKPITTVTETDTAMNLGNTGTIMVSINPAVETDLTVLVERTKAVTIIHGTDTATALAIGRTKTVTIEFGSVADTAVGGIGVLKSRTLTIAPETDAAQTIQQLFTGTLHTVTEADIALPLTATLTQATIEIYGVREANNGESTYTVKEA